MGSVPPLIHKKPGGVVAHRQQMKPKEESKVPEQDETTLHPHTNTQHSTACPPPPQKRYNSEEGLLPGDSLVSWRSSIRWIYGSTKLFQNIFI